VPFGGQPKKGKKFFWKTPKEKIHPFGKAPTTILRNPWFFKPNGPLAPEIKFC